MHLTATIVKLISPLRSMFAGSPIQNLTELLATDAFTVSLNPLLDITADLSKFGEAVEILFNKHFPVAYLALQDQHDPWAVTVLRMNQAILMEPFGTVYDPNKSSPCALASQVIDRCEEPMPDPGSFHAVLEAEAVRTRECAANSISPAYKGMSTLVSCSLENNHDLYSRGMSSRVAESVQEYEFARRFWSYWEGLLELKISTSKSWTDERKLYLGRLERMYLKAARDISAASAIDLDDSVAIDDRRAVDSYWTILCRCARGPLIDADNSTASLFPEMFQQPAFW